MPLYSIGSSLGSLYPQLDHEAHFHALPRQGFQADQVDTQRIALAEGAAGAQQDAQAQGRQQAAEVRRQAHGFSSRVECAPMVPQPLEFAAQPIRLRQWTKDMPMPTRVLRGLVAALPLFLAACSDSAPSSEEIARLLAERGFDKPACASSTLFKTFPVTLSDSFSGPGPAKGNAAVYDALVGVGLLRRDGDSYDLTPAGREDYKPGVEGLLLQQRLRRQRPFGGPRQARRLRPGRGKGWLVTVESSHAK